MYPLVLELLIFDISLFEDVSSFIPFWTFFPTYGLPVPRQTTIISDPETAAEIELLL